MSTFQPLFSIEEAFARLGQSGSRGCLMIFNAKEEIRLFVQDGSIVAIMANDKPAERGEIERALALPDSSFRWLPDMEPAKTTMRVDIQEYVSGRTTTRESRHKTIRMTTYQKREKKLDYQYFFVPEEMPTAKLRLKKMTCVAGREASCDVAIDSFQVSRRHCVLEVTDRGVLVKDLDSTNGTFINGAPVRDGYINEGDRLSLGTYGLTLRREKV